MSNIQVLDVSSTVPSYAGHRTAEGRTIPGSETVLLAVTGQQAQTLQFLAAERVAVGRPASAGSDAAAADAMRRHRPDDRCPVINRRILVISRSPALSRAIQASLGPGYQVVTSSNVIDVEEEVSEEGPFDILVAGPVFDSHAGMARLANLRATSAVPAVVLALGPKPKANLGDIVRTGAVELVEYPTSKRQLSSALKRAFDIADASQSGSGPTVPVVADGVVVGTLALRRGVHGRFVERRLRQDLLRHQPGLLSGRPNRATSVPGRSRPPVRRGLDSAAPAAPVHHLGPALPGASRRGRPRRAPRGVPRGA